MGPIIAAPVGPVHPNNAKPGVFTNSLPSLHMHNCVGNVGIFSELCSFSSNCYHSKQSSPKKNRYKARWHGTHAINSYFQAIGNVHLIIPQLPLFVCTSMRHVWIKKSPQVCKVILDLFLTS